MNVVASGDRMRRLTAEIDGETVHYRSVGEGTPVVLLHGLSGSWRWWRQVAPLLAASHRVMCLDLPGFGSIRSRRSALSDASEWLERFLVAAIGEAAHLVGHSMGASICARLTARRPDAVKTLALVAPSGIPSGSLAGHVIPLLKAAALGGPRFWALLGADAARAGPLTLLAGALHLAGEDVRHDLRVLEAPTLLVSGQRDPLVPPSLAERWRRDLRRVELVVLPGAAHVPMLETPQELSDVLLRFFSAYSEASPEAGRVSRTIRVTSGSRKTRHRPPTA